jgi:hypothetical protein
MSVNDKSKLDIRIKRISNGMMIISLVKCVYEMKRRRKGGREDLKFMHTNDLT